MYENYERVLCSTVRDPLQKWKEAWYVNDIAWYYKCCCQWTSMLSL